MSYPLALADGRVLHTLHDARDVLLSDAAFSGVTHWPPLEHAIELLLAAAETGADADIKAATEQVHRVLVQKGLMA
ncbi:MAG: hypothetical protein GEU91_18585 [Rhizobiales bacterium]|nr:hypothetical protein [Hyphomicrobiales bacterium]